MVLRHRLASGSGQYDNVDFRNHHVLHSTSVLHVGRLVGVATFPFLRAIGRPCHGHYLYNRLVGTIQDYLFAPSVPCRGERCFSKFVLAILLSWLSIPAVVEHIGCGGDVRVGVGDCVLISA